MKMLVMQKTLRENNELIIKLKEQSADNKIPFGVLSQGVEGIKGALLQFKQTKEADRHNEMRPG